MVAAIMLCFTALLQGDVYSAHLLALESWNTAIALVISTIVKLSTPVERI